MNSTSKNNAEKSINLLDILKYLLFHWRWFLVSILICGGYYLYQYATTPFMYVQSETVMIKTPMNTPTTARITRTNAAYNSVSVTGEILQLKSKELMRQAIDRVEGDVSYSIRKGLRDYELYEKSPVHVKVSKGEGTKDDGDQTYSFTVTPIDASHAMIKNWTGEKKVDPIKVVLNKETKTPFGSVMVTASEYYTEDAFGTSIRVTKYPLERMVAYYLGNLTITQMEEDATILQISMTDRTPERAAALIMTLVDVYNEISIADKNQIAVSTAEFIRDRLDIIENELGSVESQIEQLRVSNQGVDVGVAGQMYLSDS